jgi:hypothetical protein
MVTAAIELGDPRDVPKRYHDHPLESFGYYCEYPFGDVGSPVFVFDVHCHQKVSCPFTVNGLHGD